MKDVDDWKKSKKTQIAFYFSLDKGWIDLSILALTKQ
jgi:hypothetical protein